MTLDNMKILISLGFMLCLSLHVKGQGTAGRQGLRIPSLSDILRDTGTLESAVVDLASSGFGGAPAEFGGPQDGFGAPQIELVNQGFVNQGSSGAASVGHEHGHAHGQNIQHGNAPEHGPVILTDVQGNIPPAPTGVHVDLPGEHGNTHDFPVIHHGEVPIVPAKDPVPLPIETSHSPNTVTRHPVNSVQSSNPFHATNVHHNVPASETGAGRFDDLAAIGNDVLGFTGNGLRPTLINLPPDGPVITRDHEFAPHTPTNTGASSTDGFVSSTDGFLAKPTEIHSGVQSIQRSNNRQGGGSLHKEHGNPIDGSPVIHREIGAPTAIGQGQHDIPFSGEPVIHSIVADTGAHLGTLMGNVHVDMPGEHGNPIDGHPVIHREVHNGAPITVPTNIHNVGSLPGGAGDNVHIDAGHRPHVDISGIHIDAPGEHGNMLDEPALHLPPGATVQDAIAAGVIPNPFGSEPDTVAPLDTTNVGSRPGTANGNVHVDMPGEHGNPVDAHPVIHREGPFGEMRPTTTHLGARNMGLPVGTPVSNVHVDLPGEHGNPVDGHPVVHREGPPSLIPQTEVQVGHGSQSGKVHVDLPGQHGNPIDGHPVIHREGMKSLVSPTGVAVGTGSFGQPVGTHSGNVHVDLPGQHGNAIVGHPVVHREGPHGLLPHASEAVGNSIFGQQVGTQAGNVHVDMPGQHGNPLDSHPVVHREGNHGTGGSIPSLGIPLGNVHVDMPGQHGNPLDSHPVVHREGNHGTGGSIPSPGIPLGNVHVDMPGQHGNPLDSHPAVHREGHHPGSGINTHVGNVHVDMPGEHGNPIDGLPTVHRNTPVLRPVVPTGVLPGAVNVPVPPGFRTNDVVGQGRGRSLGDLLGLPTVRLSESSGFNNLEATNFGVVDDRSVLLTNDWRRPRNGWRGGRRGRGRGRRGRRRTTTTTTTTTTPVPKNQGNGITIIRTSRPNPLAALGNALRSALNVNNSGGGGLLGSLFRSAVGAQQSPVRIQPVGGGLFGGLFRGKR